MSNCTVNFNPSGASTNSTTVSIGLWNSLQACTYIVNLLFCLPAHIHVIWLILTDTGSGIAAGFFNLNLSVCETGICLKSLVFILSMWFESLSTLDQFFVGFSITGRPLFQCLICVERYLAVVHPVTFLKYKPLRYRAICCAAAWIICLGSCLFCMFTIGSIHQLVYLWFMSTQLLLLLSIQLFCCVAVLRALKQSGPGERGREREEENHMKRRAFHLILITSVTMLVLYGPFTITGFFTIITHSFVDSQAVWTSALICFLLAGFVHPVLYLHRTGKMFCLCFPKNLLL